MDAQVLLEPRTPSSARHHQVSGGHPVPLAREPSRKPCAGNPHARFPRGSYGNSSTRRGKVDLPMRGLLAVGLLLSGCGSVKGNAAIDAAAADTAAIDGAAIDAPPPDADPGPHLVFVTSTVHDCAFGGITAADAFCQARAVAAGLPGSYKAWLADANGSPATRMTRHVGIYQLVTGAAIAQGWNDLTDGNLANKIDRTEGGAQLGGVGCDASQPSCHFVCAGGE